METVKESNKDPLEKFLTPRELSELLGVSTKTIYHWVLRREIPYTKMGKHLRFSVIEVITHFKKKTTEDAQACPSFASLLQSRHRSLKISQRNFADKR